MSPVFSLRDRLYQLYGERPDLLEVRKEAGGVTLGGYVAALVVAILCTGINWGLSHWFDPTNLAMIYLLGVVFTATRFSRGPSVVCALVGVIAFDFFFVPPVFTLRFGDTQYLLTALVLLVAGLWIRYLRRPTVVRWLAMLVIVTLLYFTHLQGFGLAGLVVTAYAALTRKPWRG